MPSCIALSSTIQQQPTEVLGELVAACASWSPDCCHASPKTQAAEIAYAAHEIAPQLSNVPTTAAAGGACCRGSQAASHRLVSGSSTLRRHLVCCLTVQRSPCSYIRQLLYPAALSANRESVV